MTPEAPGVVGKLTRADHRTCPESRYIGTAELTFHPCCIHARAHAETERKGAAKYCMLSDWESKMAGMIEEYAHMMSTHMHV
jgi:hypothetical protein